MLGLFGRSIYKGVELIKNENLNGNQFANGFEAGQLKNGRIDKINIEDFYSKYALDVIGEAVFNYQFDSLSRDTEIIKAVYVLLKETEKRATEPIYYYEWPLVKDLIPR